MALALAAAMNAALGLAQYAGFAEGGAPGGFLQQRNQLASLLVCALCALAVLSRFRATAGWGAAVCAVVLALTGSRTGLVELLAISIWWLFGPQPTAALPRRFLLVGTWGGYLLGAILAPLAVGRSVWGVGILARANEGGAACNSRLTLWSNVLDLIAQKPVLGWGWGNLDYAHFTTLFQGVRFCELLDNAHNLPLHLAVVLGVPLALAFCALCTWGLWRGKPWAERNQNRLMAWDILMVIGIHSMVEYPLWYVPFQITVLMCLWILWRTPAQFGDGLPLATEPLSLSAVRSIRLAVAVGFVLIAVMAADYYRASQIYLPPSQRLMTYRDHTMEKVQSSLFFQDQLDFARLALTTVTVENAMEMHALALKTLHFSPEAMVVQQVLISAHLLGLRDEYDFYSRRYAAAYPDSYRQWAAIQPAW
ncbi:MAG: Wzy polymerase domain-containing protein [Rhodoferax sp.]|nr:Wzy polymerase domain-containing protein [Rhodoferax sp.]